MKNVFIISDFGSKVGLGHFKRSEILTKEIKRYFKKEINVFFDSLYGIIIFSIFFLINGLFIWIFPSSNIFQYGISSLEIFFDVVPYIFILFISSITMKIISEERSLGTFEILLSQPISYKEIILAKFLSCWFLSIFLIFLTFPYWITIYYLSNP